MMRSAAYLRHVSMLDVVERTVNYSVHATVVVMDDLRLRDVGFELIPDRSVFFFPTRTVVINFFLLCTT